MKIVVDAYTGQVTLYAMPQPDPILEAWRSIFPGLIQPFTNMPTVLRRHLRYPEDIFSIQSAIWGRYHITKPSVFYSNGDGWSLSPTDGAGPPNSALVANTSTNKQGDTVTTTFARMDPLYQIYTLPGTKQPQFTLSDAYVAASSAASASASSNGATPVLPLRAFIVALSDPSDYGELHVYQPSPGVNVPGPVQADAAMISNIKASTQITLLGVQKSVVLLGNVLMLPINGSMLYVRPFYVSAEATNLPLLNYFITDYNNTIGFSPSLGTAVDEALGMTPQQGTGGNTSKFTVKQLLDEATRVSGLAQAALHESPPNFTLYGKYVNEENALIARAVHQLGGGARTRGRTSGTAHVQSSSHF